MKKVYVVLLFLFFIIGGYLAYVLYAVWTTDDSLNRGTVAEKAEHVVPVAKDKMQNTNKKAKVTKGKVEVYVQWAIRIADDDTHGYSQGAENATGNHPYTGSREGPDYDCASFVYHALAQAGFPIIESWRQNPAYYDLYQGKQVTGDADTIWTDLQKVGGFARYSWDEVKDDLQRGDILCNPEVHVAVYIGDGKTVEARGVNNPRGGSWRTGDQGGEIDFYNAYGRRCTEVYRYIE